MQEKNTSFLHVQSMTSAAIILGCFRSFILCYTNIEAYKKYAEIMSNNKSNIHDILHVEYTVDNILTSVENN